MNNLSADAWIAEHSPIAPEKLHAMGVIAYTWNSCESHFRILLCRLNGRRWVEVWAETFDARYKDIAAQIKTLTNEKKLSAEAREAVLFVLGIYEINRLNRNQFTHFQIFAAPDGAVFVNNKRSSFEDMMRLPPIPNGVEDIRRVAEDLETLRKYMIGVIDHLTALWRYPRSKPPALPDRPPAPQRLWTPPQPPSAPESSRPRRSLPR